jgi:hypothetical protein
MALCPGIVAALDFSHAPPVDRGRIAVLLVARNDAALAADALRHVEVKTVLLARSRLAARKQLGRRFDLYESGPASREGDVDQIGCEERERGHARAPSRRSQIIRVR